MKIVIAIIMGLVLVSGAYADFSTGFDSSEGYSTSDGTFIGIDSWQCSQPVARSITQDDDPPAPYAGDLYARIKSFSTSTRGYRLFSAGEQIGATGETYTAEVSVSMAVQNLIPSGMGLVYVTGAGLGDDAAIFGIKGGTSTTFSYNDGGTWQTIGSVTSNTWYKFDVVLYGNGSGGGTYSLTISGGDLGSDIVVTGISYRDSTVEYIGGVSLYTERGDSSDVYFDDLFVALVPEPKTFSTGFEVSEGYSTSDGTFIGVNGWQSGENVTRSITQDDDPPAPYAGELYARIKSYSTATRSYKMLSAIQQIGATGETYTAEVSVAMAVQNLIPNGSALVYVTGAALGDDAADFGIWGGTSTTFSYNDGGTWRRTGSVSSNTWYKFDAVLHGNGSGGGTYDLTISGGDLSADIVVTGISYRDSTVDYIGSISLFTERGEFSDVYFDDLSVVPHLVKGTLVIIQ